MEMIFLAGLNRANLGGAIIHGDLRPRGGHDIELRARQVVVDLQARSAGEYSPGWAGLIHKEELEHVLQLLASEVA